MVIFLLLTTRGGHRVCKVREKFKGSHWKTGNGIYYTVPYKEYTFTEINYVLEPREKSQYTDNNVDKESQV